MERTVFQKLKAWKQSPSRKPLILNGARQVGKTWLLREFARREYKNEAYILCRNNPIARSVFEGDFDMQRILLALKSLSNVDIAPKDTLIILDEIQDIPLAIESLKYFCEELPDYHIAVAGSLLGLAIHKDVSFPVGKVDTIDIYPMSFEEFLMAKGKDELLKLLQSKDYQLINSFHRNFLAVFREYLFVGGMPEAVKEYVETGALNTVRSIQKSILSGYDLDFSKHAPKELVPRIRMVWKSIPTQLFKENKKFIYGVIKTGARAKEFELAIEWLVQAGLVYRIPRCTKPALPLAIYEDTSAFKLYHLDVGLLGAMADTASSQILLDKSVFVEFKGGLAEQIVCQQMKSKDIAPIFYHSSDDSRLEIDFLIQNESHILPIEVKSGYVVRANSLSNFLLKNPDLYAIRYSLLPPINQDRLLCRPLYMIGY